LIPSKPSKKNKQRNNVKALIYSYSPQLYAIDWNYTNSSFSDPSEMTEIPQELALEYEKCYNKLKELSLKLGVLKEQHEITSWGEYGKNVTGGFSF
jgi:hypothetical protein